MYIPVSIFWVHVIAIIVFFILGKKISGDVEPILTDNVISEIYDLRTPVFLLAIGGSILVASLLGLGELFIPSLEICSDLLANVNLYISLFYFLMHAFAFYSLPIIFKFLRENYKYKAFVFGVASLSSFFALHFFFFFTLSVIAILRS